MTPPLASAMHVRRLRISTPGRGMQDLTPALSDAVRWAGARDGLCHVFVHHTSASLIVCENADPDVRVDLETLFARLFPDGDPAYVHTCEGPDDMSAHARSVVTQTSLTVPIADGRLALGTWQGVYLWEHRAAAHARRVTVTVQAATHVREG